MLILAHIGIPVTAAWLSQKAMAGVGFKRMNQKPASTGATVLTASADANPAISRSHFFQVDYRLLMLGSVLPDIIDKPLGLWLLADVFSNGRIFAHTLLFTLLLVIAGVYVYLRTGRSGSLSVSFGSVAHLCLDQIWLNRTTFLWPFYGGFEKTDVSHWLGRLLTSVTSEPIIWATETISALLLAAFLLNLVRQHRLGGFIRSGRTE